MKRLFVGAAVAAIATASFIALSSDAADRPAGVSPGEWVPVTPSLGIVLIPGQGPAVGRVEPTRAGIDQPRVLPGGAPLGGTALLLKPPVAGYFMVKGAGGWTRLVLVEPLKGPGDAG